jgi:hypothetical protein
VWDEDDEASTVSVSFCTLSSFSHRLRLWVVDDEDVLYSCVL